MKFLTGLTLGKKTILLTAAGLILGVGVFSFLAIRAVNQATEAMLQDRLTTARLMADYIDETLKQALTELQDTAQLVEVDDTSGNFEMRIESLEDIYRRLSIYAHGIYLLDNQGLILRSKPGTPQVEGISLFDNPSIKETARTGEATISGLVSAPGTDVPVIFITSPTKEEQGGSKGMLVAAIDLAQSSIGGFIKPIRLGQTGYVEIVDQNGIVVARTEPGPELAPFEKSDHSGRFAALIAAGEPTRGLCHTCHEPVLRVERWDVLAFVPLTTARWGAIIRQSEEEALAPIRELRQSLLLSGSLLLTIAFLFVAMFTHNIVNHIRMLTVSSRRIAEGDLTSPVTSSRQDEIGILARTFDDMRVKLKASRGELEQRTKELSSLLSVSEILTSLSDLSNLDTALGSALDKTLEIMGGNAGGILLMDAEKQMLCYRVYRGSSTQQPPQVCYGLGEGIAGIIAQTNETIVIDEISADPHADRLGSMAAEGIKSLASVPLHSKNKVLGAVYIASDEAGKFSSQDVQLLEGISRQIATAIENAELHQEVQHKEEIRGELLREIFSIQEEERKRIARELHDEMSQSLASLNAGLEVAIGMLPTSIDKAKATLRKAQTLSISILDDIQKLIYELRPTLLDDLGLVTAIRWLAENNLEASGINVDFKTTGREKKLSSELDTTLFRVIQETASNITRHAHAKNVQIRLRFKKNTVEACIKDDGDGFDVEEAISSKDRPRGLGLLGMKERVSLMNGTLRIRSRPGGNGTRIDIKIPLKSEVYDG